MGRWTVDDRLVSEHGNAVAECIKCGGETSKMNNCHNLDCDKLMVICCGKHCRKECEMSIRQRKENVVEEIIGRVENYYGKNGVALVKVEKEIVDGMTVTVRGKTTNFTQAVRDMKTHEDNLITFPVSEKVRKNDLILM